MLRNAHSCQYRVVVLCRAMPSIPCMTDVTHLRRICRAPDHTGMHAQLLSSSCEVDSSDSSPCQVDSGVRLRCLAASASGASSAGRTSRLSDAGALGVAPGCRPEACLASDSGHVDGEFRGTCRDCAERTPRLPVVESSLQSRGNSGDPPLPAGGSAPESQEALLTRPLTEPKHSEEDNENVDRRGILIMKAFPLEATLGSIVMVGPRL